MGTFLTPDCLFVCVGGSSERFLVSFVGQEVCVWGWGYLSSPGGDTAGGGAAGGGRG